MPRSPGPFSMDSVKTNHLLLGILATFIVAVAGVGWVALSTIQSLKDTAVDSERWIQVNSVLLELSDNIGGLVAETHGRARRRVPLDIEVDLLKFKTGEWTDQLRLDLTSVAGEEQRDEIDDAIQRFEDSGLDLIDTAGLVVDAHAADDEAEVDRQLRRLLNEHQAFRLHLQKLQGIADEIESRTLTQLVEGSEGRFRQVLIAGVPVAGLIVGMLFLSRRVRRREDALLTDVRHEQQRSQAIVDCLPAEIAWKTLAHELLGTNRVLQRRLDGWDIADPLGRTFAEVGPDEARETWLAVEELEDSAIAERVTKTAEYLVRAEGTGRTLRFSCSPLVQDDETIGVVTFSEDVTEAREMERALATSGRMESIGQLAAGVAHEINTPIQFVSDNTDFLTESFADVIAAADQLSDVCRQHDGEAVTRILGEADMDFLRGEVPQALSQSKDGLGRVSEIVQAMKNFSHPGTELADTDLNQIIDSTVSISRSEWKYIADLELDLDEDLPLVRCREGELKQVVLNMVVNASHAIAEKTGTESKGRIVVATSLSRDLAQITITDNGAGMSPEVRERIFDQFFTTKAVGKGTGQGLALAWDIVRSHDGTIEVESEVGVGTTFRISLPLNQAHADASAKQTTESGQPALTSH